MVLINYSMLLPTAIVTNDCSYLIRQWGLGLLCTYEWSFMYIMGVGIVHDFLYVSFILTNGCS